MSVPEEIRIIGMTAVVIGTPCAVLIALLAAIGWLL